ncbi:VCBS domain-containing protein [Chromobacterium piscinae]|uniref:VCBS domain-containing protein n=1 Tax=Chromobacterium piscinae TaxID=686831 RepID=UPI00320819D9
MNVADADQGQSVFNTSRVDNKTANLGWITIDANGNWHYSVDNAKVQYLGQGESSAAVHRPLQGRHRQRGGVHPGAGHQ